MAELLQIRRAVSPPEIGWARQIRQQVFVDEQGIPAALEYADGDQNAIHLLAYLGDRGQASAVATARLVFLSQREGAVTRVAVLPAQRGKGYGRALVQQLEVVAQEYKLARLTLNPHHYLEHFYRELGYTTVPGGEMEVAGHQLITMQKALDCGCFQNRRSSPDKDAGFETEQRIDSGKQ